MTDDELRQFLETNKEEIAQSVKAKTIEALTRNLEWSLPDTVRKTVAEFVEAEIVPELKAHLKSNKGPMVEATIKAASQIGDKVAEKMVETAIESMTGYRSGDVLKALMGVSR